MSDFLFAYGTMQPGLAPAEIVPHLAKLVPIGEAFVHGVLYDLGGYPGAILNPSSQQRIIGNVYQLPEDSSVLTELDAYEEFDPASPASSLFLRILHPVILATGGTLQCWVYVYNRDPGSAPVISGGKFRKCS
ncbi:MAG TPA: gamma-glutamylcyclotransferase family protein [Terracidiphilus sp.]|jgi:gamma-glutamylcyclotransferase (GGCT)/AIG2-like uncharacterized protein YtfP|nr:gamma-glutamylcyclotransferase family protein [Terracidiphilus sp.]